LGWTPLGYVVASEEARMMRSESSQMSLSSNGGSTLWLGSVDFSAPSFSSRLDFSVVDGDSDSDSISWEDSELAPSSSGFAGADAGVDSGAACSSSLFPPKALKAISRPTTTPRITTNAAMRRRMESSRGSLLEGWLGLDTPSYYAVLPHTDTMRMGVS